jgi:hypothetical protein
MSTTLTGTARRFALTLTVAGIAALGGVAVAPVASAAQASGVVLRDGTNGPAAFVLLDHGKEPVFLCDADTPNKQHNNCLDITGPTRF